MDVVVVSHTHWDREWYQLAGRFRQRLVRLVDELLDSNAPPFLLDGQAIVLDDYLAVRPERQADLAAAFRNGRLEAGPWYVLADELIPGGECLVRNLLAGRRAMNRIGASPPPVLYSPDAFGHPAVLPLLAQGFGFGVVVLWRGYGGRRWPSGDSVRWQAADGVTSVVLYHLAPPGYELGSNLPADRAGAAERWRELRATLEPRARLGLALLPNGADHHALQDDAVAALESLATAAAPDVVRRGTLGSFASELLSRAEGADLPSVTGELRDSYGYTWTLQGTLGVRAAQKRRMRAVERTLVRDVEPWIAISAAMRAVDMRPLLNAAWVRLLECCPHDSLCGCSIDGVSAAVDARLDDASAQCAGLRREAVAAVIGHDASLARARRADWRDVLVIRNPAARPRGGVAEVSLLAKLADEPVGPGSGSVPIPASLSRKRASRFLGGLQHQILGRTIRRDRIESPRHYPDNDLVSESHALVWSPPVRGYGTLSIDASGNSRTPPVENSAPSEGKRQPDAPRAIIAKRDSLYNGVLRVSVNERGQVRLQCRAHSHDVASLVNFECQGDGGDLYTFSPRGIASEPRFLGTRLVHRGPLRGELRLRWRLSGVGYRRPSASGGGSKGRTRRTSGSVILQMSLQLDAEAEFLRVLVSGDNRAHDHRLRVTFATGIIAAAVHADAAFTPVARLPLVVDAADLTIETPPPTAPLHRYVSLFGIERGVTIYSDGLAEYEALDGGGVAVTLLRAVGELSRSDLPERPGHAGWPASTPDAQQAGPYEAAFAVFPHGPRDAAVCEGIERTADDVLLPLVGSTFRDAYDHPAPTAGVELDGASLAFSACAPAERDGWTMVRCVNRSGESRAGLWRFGWELREACTARLDETVLDSLPVIGNTVRFVAAPHSVMTVLVR